MREFVTVKKSSLEKLVEPGRESSVTDAEWSELRAVIAQEAGPVVERQEPAAWIRKITDVDGKDYQTIIATQKPAVFYPYQWDSRPLDGFKIIDTPLYTSPPAPVAVVDLLREISDYLDGSTRNAVWCDSILHKKMKVCLDKVKELNQ